MAELPESLGELAAFVERLIEEKPGLATAQAAVGATGPVGPTGPTGPAGPAGPLLARRTLTVTTASLAAGATDTPTLTAGLADRAYRVTTSRPAWVRVYPTAAYRTADAGRAQSVDPGSQVPLLMEVITAASLLTVDLPWEVKLFNLDGPAAGTLYLAVTNLDTVTGTVQVDLLAGQEE